MTGAPARGVDPHEPWPREFGRDGVSGLLTLDRELDRVLRVGDVSHPQDEDEKVALEVVEKLLARVNGRR